MATTVQVPTNIRPFHVDIPDEKLADLRRRIAATRWPSAELVTDSSQGVQSKMLQKLARYWEKEHDWRKVEKKLNALPQFSTTIDGLDIHFIHVKSRHKDAMPLIITHGWPGSVIEMLDVIGPLTDPTAYGGGADEGFDLVVPSLPGFGFSGQPTELGWNPGRVARAWAELMQRLGYTRYVAQGGDIGANVTDELARLAPAGLAGIHLNFLSAFPFEVGAALFGGLLPAGLFKRVVIAALAAHAEKKEPVALDALAALFRRGYFVEMPEHPQTIGYALTDTPVGLAAWMLDHDEDSYEKISRAFLEGKVDQDDIRVFPHSVEHDLLAVGGHIEGLRGSGVVEAAQLARLFRREVEQPEVLRRKRSLRVHERQAIWNESITLSFNPKPDCRQFDFRAVCSNGQ